MPKSISRGAGDKQHTIQLLLCRLFLTVHAKKKKKKTYKLSPANKTDRLCQSWQRCHMFMQSCGPWITKMACSEGARLLGERVQQVFALLASVLWCGSSFLSCFIASMMTTPWAADKAPTYITISHPAEHLGLQGCVGRSSSCSSFLLFVQKKLCLLQFQPASPLLLL